LKPGIGIVGAGAIAEAHMAAYRAVEAPVVAVMSRRLASAQRLARVAGASLATDQLSELLGDPAVEAVDVCTPTDDHAATAVAAARAGKHVHVEKPMALSLDEADGLIEACRAAGVKLMVGQTARYHAVSRALRAVIVAGEVGRPFHLELVWDHATFWPGGWRGWHIDPARSGGHLVHNGVHAFDLVSWLFGDVAVRVYAQARAVAHPALESPDYWHATVEMAGGATALCEIGYVLRSPGGVHRSAWVYGTEGTASHATVDDGVVFGAGGPRSAGLMGELPLVVQLREWVQCLRGDGEPPVSGEEGRLALALALAARRSAEIGEPVDVGPLASLAGSDNKIFSGREADSAGAAGGARGWHSAGGADAAQRADAAREADA
jgi:predicted dehydrogenase